MALTGKRGWVTAAVVVGLAATVLLVLSLMQLQRVSRFNESLKTDSYELAAGDASAYGIFVKAYLHQQKNEFDAAVEQYSRIENAEDEAFRHRLRYNMATLYMQRAMAARQAGDRDIALPLIELAKHLYRELLRADPQNWSAKYNLEQALKLAPEMAEEEIEDDVLPERSPEATGSVEIDRELP